ncbi:DUF1963 domain-containing protein [Kitasatospora sp. NPDC048194]|uniref:DUF1963 domain-containing protein n=1 Tax=Kitasatospora sp. NPDC048194 TaxID=3364045 RepID=UPI00371A511A
MTTLMTYAGPAEPDRPATRTGGLPLAPAGTVWPTCAACRGPMQFLAQIHLDDLGRHVGQGTPHGRGVLGLFMCQNNPGLCAEWDPKAGGNRALLFPADGLRPLVVPDLGEDGDPQAVLLGAVSAIAFQSLPVAADYGEARAEWLERSGRPPRHVLGQLGGEPDWLQGDETPDCPGCSQPMPLAVRLEEGQHAATAMNFGGGAAYAFACEPCTEAVFLWQC